MKLTPKAEPEKKGKGKKASKQNQDNDIENKIVTSIKWSVKEGIDINVRSGVYFLQTSIQDTEKVLWDSYNSIREIEATFRVLKTDLDLRPVYHKKDETTMAHLNLGLLAYWLVNTISPPTKKRRYKQPMDRNCTHNEHTESCYNNSSK